MRQLDSFTCYHKSFSTAIRLNFKRTLFTAILLPPPSHYILFSVCVHFRSIFVKYFRMESPLFRLDYQTNQRHNGSEKNNSYIPQCKPSINARNDNSFEHLELDHSMSYSIAIAFVIINRFPWISSNTKCMIFFLTPALAFA